MNQLVPNDLTNWTEHARRDDWHTYFVGSDIRCMLGEIERLRKALACVVRDIHEYERVNNLAPNPGRTECWDSVAEAKALLNSLEKPL